MPVIKKIKVLPASQIRFSLPGGEKLEAMVWFRWVPTTELYEAGRAVTEGLGDDSLGFGVELENKKATIISFLLRVVEKWDFQYEDGDPIQVNEVGIRYLMDYAPKAVEEIMAAFGAEYEGKRKKK